MSRRSLGWLPLCAISALWVPAPVFGTGGLNCPKSAVQILSCEGTTVRGNDARAESFAASALLCQKKTGGYTMQVHPAAGHPLEPIPVELTVRSGETQYFAKIGDWSYRLFFNEAASRAWANATFTIQSYGWNRSTGNREWGPVRQRAMKCE